MKAQEVAKEVAAAIDQMDVEFGFRNLDVVGYGTGKLAAILEDREGCKYDVRVTRREAA